MEREREREGQRERETEARLLIYEEVIDNNISRGAAKMRQTGASGCFRQTGYFEPQQPLCRYAKSRQRMSS